MKKMFTMLMAAMLSLTATAQEEFVPKTAVLQRAFSGGHLDALAEDYVFNRINRKAIAVWTGTEVAGVVANFNLSYTADSLYIYSELRLESTTTTGSDEISMTISLDPDRAAYSFDLGEPNDNGFLFSKITFGGDGASAAVAGEAKVRRNVEWIYEEVEAVEVTIGGIPMLRDGYNVEGRVAWKDISTNQALINEFKSNYLLGDRTIYFDVAYKFGEEGNYVAWSNDDNTAWESSQKLGVLTLMERKLTSIPGTETVPAFDAEKDAAYSGEGMLIENWVNDGAGIAGVSAEYWAAYDQDNLYLYAQIVVPNAEKTATVDEVTITVGVRPTDAYLTFADGDPNENGYLFSKLVFGGDNELSVFTHRGVEWIWRNAEVFDEFEGYILEAKVPWNQATTNPAMLAEFLSRGSFFFDIGYKLKGQDAFYFAWNNKDNTAWRSTYSTGKLLLEGIYISMPSVKAAADVSVWPNPVQDVLNIQSADAVESVEVFNLSGQNVLNVRLLGNLSLDVSSLNAGIYVVKVNFAAGNSAFSKFIKK